MINVCVEYSGVELEGAVADEVRKHLDEHAGANSAGHQTHGEFHRPSVWIFYVIYICFLLFISRFYIRSHKYARSISVAQ